MKDKTLYVGCTSNLEKRVREHNQNKSFYTKQHNPWKLVYFEGYTSKQDAFRREHQLKQHKQGLRRLKERLSHSLLV